MRAGEMNALAALSAALLISCVSAAHVGIGIKDAAPLPPLPPLPLVPCAKCNISITWDSPLYACSTAGNVEGPNMMCPPFGGTLFSCDIRHKLPRGTQIGFSYPGVCGCPNNCFESGKRGTCNSAAGVCECNDGWSGPDCSSVDCSVSSPCQNGGVCAHRDGLYVCDCRGGFTGDDCSVEIQKWAPIPTIVPQAPYTDSDKYGDNHPVFNTSVVAELHITLDPEDMLEILDPANQKSKEYKRASLRFLNGVMNDTVEDVGFRIKGGISRTFAKKTFKLSFNKFDKGRKWYSMKKMDIRAGAMDVSFARDTVSLAMLRSMGGYTQRYGYARMKVNGIDFGTQLMVENIDERFLKSRFEKDDGALYKCQGDLVFHGYSPDAYRNIALLGRPSYNPKTDAAEDFSQLTMFITIANQSPDEEFEADISSVLDMDVFLRTYAFDVLCGQADGICNGNNYMLYWNPETLKFEYLRHDYDASMGFGQLEFTTMDVFDWCQGGRTYQFLTRIMSVRSFRDRYAQYLKMLLDGYFRTDGPLVDRILQTRAFLAPLMRTDQWHRMDFGWSFDQFTASYEEDVTVPTALPPMFPDLTIQGLTHFIELRRDSALQQLRDNGYL